jgi:CheY-like chemotaxis protein
MLVVEDELIVRRLVVEVLEDAGYRVLEAGDGPSGLAILESAEAVDRLVSDVGLPGLNGRQLADRARETRPDLKVLFITGYTENATLASGFLQPGMEMITKPFAVEALAGKVQEMLGAGTNARAHAREFAAP